MKTSVFPAMVMAMVTVAAGCAAQDSDPVGSVGVALTATDPSGATYRLPAGTRLAMEGGTYYDEHSLDGDAAFIRIDVPPGDYAAYLVDNDGHTTEWPLERRELDGSMSTVIATLITPQPAPVTVTTDGLTNLVFQFVVTDVGPITFAEGSVDVSIVVTESTASGLRLEAESDLAVTSVSSDPAAPAELADRMPALGDTDLAVALQVSVTGPWAKASSVSACAPVVVLTTSVSQAGLGHLLAESLGETSLCIFEGADVAPIAQLFFYRFGDATTPTFADLGGVNPLFLTSLTIDLPASVFDGTTLDLGPVVGTHELPIQVFTRASVRPDTSAPRVNWYRGFLSGEVSLTLFGTP
jgi:hypothetical protein